MNYTQLSAQIQAFTENDFPVTTGSVVSADQIAQFVKNAEQRIYNTVQLPSLRKNVTGTLTAAINVICPAVTKAYTIKNATTGGYAVKVVGSGPTTGITVANGKKALIAWNGSDFVKVSSSVADGVTSVSGTGTVNGITLTGTVTSTGSLTLGGTLSGVDLTSQVTGTLPVANGGTGATSLTANNVILGNGTSAVQVVAPGTSGNVLTSNGTTWTSSTPAAGGITAGQSIAFDLIFAT